MSRDTSALILAPIIERVEQYGFPWFISADEMPDIVLMVDMPEEWHRRSPSREELDYFFGLYRAGHVEQAHEFARNGGFSGWREEASDAGVEPGVTT